MQARRGQLPLYMLIELESKLVELQAMLVSDNRLKRYQRTKYTNMQGRIFTLWDEYSEGKRTTSSLLVACSKLYKPTVSM